MSAVGGYISKAGVGSRRWPLATFATVYDAAQNISGEFTHPIGRTKSIHSMVDVYVGRGGTTYVKAPVSARHRRHR